MKIRAILLLLLLVGSALGADVPCYFDGSDFQVMVHSEADGDEAPTEGAEAVTFAGPRDTESSSKRIPIITDPTKEISSIIENVRAAVDPGETIVHNKVIELSAMSPGPTNIGQIYASSTNTSEKTGTTYQIREGSIPSALELTPSRLRRPSTRRGS